MGGLRIAFLTFAVGMLLFRRAGVVRFRVCRLNAVLRALKNDDAAGCWACKIKGPAKRTPCKCACHDQMAQLDKAPEMDSAPAALIQPFPQF